MAKKSSPASTDRFRFWRHMAQILIIGLACYVLAPQLVNLRENSSALTDISLLWLPIAAVIFMGSFFFAALVYRALCGSEIQIKRTFYVQLATAFTNRLLPSGIGGIGTNTLALIRYGHKKTSALSYVSLNNLVGFVAFVLVLTLTRSLSFSSLVQLFGESRLVAMVLIGVIGAIAVISFVSAKLRQHIVSSITQVFQILRALMSRPMRATMSLIASSGIPLCYILALYCCLTATGVTLPLNQIVLVFAAGAIATSASPTPGGLGAAELAMVAALRQFDISESSALACVMAFRLVSFWLPIIPGYIFFRICAARKYI